MQQEDNRVTIIGTISEPFKLSHKLSNNKFNAEVYSTILDVKRSSGEIDRVPIEILASEYLIKSFEVGTKISVEGEIRSYNIGVHLKVVILVNKVAKIEDKQDLNEIQMMGYICKQPIFRTTPFGRRICDVFVAIPRRDKKSSYIPCILWGRNAEYASSLKVGERVNLGGRVQSRDYIKKIDDQALKKTTIEVSCNWVALI